MWTQQMIPTKRGTFELFTKGNGEPLCITHHYSQFNETGDYFADVFTATHRVFLINLRDAGSSVTAQSENELSMIETVNDLEAIREALQLPTWHFTGHSTGGMLGLLYAITYPNSLQSLVVAGAAASNYTETPFCIYHPEHSQFHYMQELIENLKSPHLTSEERKELSTKRTKLSLYKPENYNSYFCKPIKKTMSVSRMNAFANEYPSFDLREYLPSIKTKTLIMCGRHDVQCPIQYSIEIHEGICDSTFVTFEESNHYPFLEEAAQFTSTTQIFYKSLQQGTLK
ncbi:proline iminopeptidase [Bacillus thuringiensis serovar israelensis]|nr:proline iminopeptidase [Bacillus thuringiensis HD-789]AJH04168.1 alpha/beta hydrolase fold family protein [Bacillus thuringiensis HD1002]AND26570.1 proline iminopeptidase [Bacillus thuringiensis serovar israelensis]KRD83554.1 proline iminopeptidase [Bacillus sp. Root11]KRD88865.1 proline iminopeptidase [Bacillus sp. Root131]OTX59997.1 proline iminopeptidase [Bacillus thuringiensis serovar novosibirsk]RCX39447.1 proline iminopeptidase [Bacillus sp. AG102]TWE72893.1 proline iminopeptidase [